MIEERKLIWNKLDEDVESIWYTIDLIDTFTNENGEIHAECDVPLWIEIECLKEYDRNTGILINESPIYGQVVDSGGHQLYSIVDMKDDSMIIKECQKWILENEYNYY